MAVPADRAGPGGAGVGPAIARVAADIGGTFTDIAALTDDGRLITRKLPSTPENYGEAVADGILALLSGERADPGAVREVLHGCTVATNAIIEHKGARTALVTTRGFRDVLELQRIRVPRLYDPLYEKPAPLVPRQLRFELDERLAADGTVIRPLDRAEAEALAARIRAAGVEAVAVCLLHAFVNPAHERELGAILARSLPGCFISLSVDVLPQKGEYERSSTTVINAYVGPPVRRYLGAMADRLDRSGIAGRLMVMQSSGGILDADSCLEKPAHIVECGPAAGVVGAERMAREAGFENVITLDMGGTTAKASVIEKGRLAMAEEYEVGGGMSSASALVGRGGYALKLPVIDIAEVGAGGGSIAWLDRAGALRIGPESAGAVPGPACYGLGNDRPTVTDANLVLGYLNPRALAGGTVPVRAELAERAVADHVAAPMRRGLLETAHGIHTVANATMMRAVRAVTTQRGRDPRDFALLAFGGAGGLHAVDLARVLRIREVVLPMAGGVFSAVGLLFSDLRVDETAPLLAPLDAVPAERVEAGFAALAGRIARIIGGRLEAIAFRRLADLRFRGQAYELTVPLPEGALDRAARRELADRFEASHMARYGHAFSGEFPVDLVNLRLVGTRSAGAGADIEARPPSAAATAGAGPGPVREAWFGPAQGRLPTPVVTRADLGAAPVPGPLIIEEYEGTAVVPPNCRARLDRLGNVIISLPAGE